MSAPFAQMSAVVRWECPLVVLAMPVWNETECVHRTGCECGSCGGRDWVSLWNALFVYLCCCKVQQTSTWTPVGSKCRLQLLPSYKQSWSQSPNRTASPGGFQLPSRSGDAATAVCTQPSEVKHTWDCLVCLALNLDSTQQIQQYSLWSKVLCFLFDYTLYLILCCICFLRLALFFIYLSLFISWLDLL